MGCQGVVSRAFVIAIALCLSGATSGCAKTTDPTPFGELPPDGSNPDTTSVTPPSAESSAVPRAMAGELVLWDDGWLLGTVLPANVGSVMDRMGPPHDLDTRNIESDPSPWGLWMRWTADGDFTYSVLAETYTAKEIDRSAAVLMSELRAGPQSPRVATAYGLEVGHSTVEDTRDAVGSALEQSRLHEREPVDPDGIFALSAKSSGPNETITYFLFDSQGLLRALTQASYDIEMSD